MRRVAKIVAPLVLVFSLAMAAVAWGAEEPPKDPAAELAKLQCDIKQGEANKAGNLYKEKKEKFDELTKINAKGVGAEQELRDARVAMLTAEIEYRKKQLDADTCFANLKNDPQKVCNALINELYRLEDELETRKVLADVAEKTFAARDNERNLGGPGNEAWRPARTARDNAIEDVKNLERAVRAQKLKIQLEPTCKDVKIKEPKDRRSELPPEQSGQQPTSTTTPEPPTSDLPTLSDAPEPLTSGVVSQTVSPGLTQVR